MGKKNDNTLVKNASFLMVAALISKIIGMLYKSPLSLHWEVRALHFSSLHRMYILSC